MRQNSLLILTMLSTFACTPTAGSDESSDAGRDPYGPLGHSESDDYSFKWRQEVDSNGVSPVSLTASDSTGLELISMNARAVLEDPVLRETTQRLCSRVEDHRAPECRLPVLGSIAVVARAQGTGPASSDGLGWSSPIVELDGLPAHACDVPLVEKDEVVQRLLT